MLVSVWLSVSLVLNPTLEQRPKRHDEGRRSKAAHVVRECQQFSKNHKLLSANAVQSPFLAKPGILPAVLSLTTLQYPRESWSYICCYIKRIGG
jgi:hypothetical protein